ncbi:hypothetical protein N7475_001001 [Penicillium sp. IBT 31633x]|nr:hypothetical protein N7475_001001 [Penicillium sp. IBT 31633x]
MGSSLRFTRRYEDEEDEPWIAHEDEIQREMTRFRSNTGRVVPTEFTPPRPGVDGPQTLFAPGLMVPAWTTVDFFLGPVASSSTDLATPNAKTTKAALQGGYGGYKAV